MNNFNLRKTRIRLEIIAEEIMQQKLSKCLYLKCTTFPTILNMLIGKVYELLPDNRHHRNYQLILDDINNVYKGSFKMYDYGEGKAFCLPNGVWLLNDYDYSNCRYYSISVKPNLFHDEGFIRLDYFGESYIGKDVDAAALAALDILLPDIVRCSGKIAKACEINRVGKLAILKSYVAKYPLKTKFYFDNRGGASIKFTIDANKFILAHFKPDEILSLTENGAPDPDTLIRSASKNGKYRMRSYKMPIQIQMLL